MPCAGVENLEVYITHNGDFDFFRLMGQDRTHHEVAAFLQAALGTSSPIKCDSVRVAGMIELLRTQGLWLPALRLAYYDTAAITYDDVIAANAGGGSGGSGPNSDADVYIDMEGSKRGGMAMSMGMPSSRTAKRSATRAELQVRHASMSARAHVQALMHLVVVTIVVHPCTCAQPRHPKRGPSFLTLPLPLQALAAVLEKTFSSFAAESSSTHGGGSALDMLVDAHLNKMRAGGGDMGPGAR